MTSVSLGLLALMVSGPFLFPFHTEPIPSFWGEWLAGAFGLAAAIFGLFAYRSRSLPGSLPLSPLLVIPAVLLVVLLLQFAIGRLIFPQFGLLYAIYLLWAGLLLALGRKLVDTIGLAHLVDVLALAVALAALISAAVALVQWLGIADRVPWVMPTSGPIWANISQRNHYAHFSWLGIASLYYLRGSLRLSRGLFWAMVLTIGFCSVLSGSRNVFLFLLVLLAALAWARRQDPHGPAAKLVTDAALLLPTLVALNFLGAWASPRIPEFWPWLQDVLPMLNLGSNPMKGGNSPISGARIYEEVSGPSLRLAILRTAWAAFVEHPWIGHGAGNFRWASFVAAADRADGDYFLIAEHAHNFVFQLLAEFGAPVTVAVILLLVFWTKQFVRQRWQLEHFWCATVLGIGAVHSLLEYPLWYSTFLGPTALLLGATDSRSTTTLTGRRVNVYLVVSALAGALILSNLRSDYSKLEATIYNPLAGLPDREQAWRISMDRLLKLYQESLLSPWVLVAFTGLAEPGRALAQDSADLCERGIRFDPQRLLATRCAMHLAIAERDAAARKLALDILRAYPAERAATAAELARGAQTFPEIEPLRLLSQQR